MENPKPETASPLVITGQGTYQRAWSGQAVLRGRVLGGSDHPPAVDTPHSYGGICIECSVVTGSKCPDCGHFVHAACRARAGGGWGCWGCKVLADMERPTPNIQRAAPPPLRVSQGGVVAAFLAGLVCGLLCVAMLLLEWRRTGGGR